MHWNCTRRTKRKWQYFLSREMGSRSQTFPSSYPVPAPQGGQVSWFNNKEDAYPWGCTMQVLLCSPLTWRPECQSTPGQWHILLSMGATHSSKCSWSCLFLLCVKDIPCITWILKTQSRLVLPGFCLLMFGKSHPRVAIKHTGTFHGFSRRVKMWIFSECVAR